MHTLPCRDMVRGNCSNDSEYLSGMRRRIIQQRGGLRV